jgi:hypothetical protein
MRLTIAKFVILISGCRRSTKRPRNVIDLCMDRIALAQTNGARRLARLLETCRAGCLVSMSASMPFVGKRPNWSHLLVVMAFLYLNQVQTEGLRYLYIMNPSVKAETPCIHRLTALASFTSCLPARHPIPNGPTLYIQGRTVYNRNALYIKHAWNTAYNKA